MNHRVAYIVQFLILGGATEFTPTSASIFQVAGLTNYMHSVDVATYIVCIVSSWYYGPSLPRCHILCQGVQHWSSGDCSELALCDLAMHLGWTAILLSTWRQYMWLWPNVHLLYITLLSVTYTGSFTIGMTHLPHGICLFKWLLNYRMCEYTIVINGQHWKSRQTDDTQIISHD